MQTSETVQAKSQAEHQLGDETFMSATELREYMKKMALASASKEIDAMDGARRAKEALVKSMAAPMELTPQRLEEITNNLLHKLRQAAERGDTEILVMRFPNEICTDKGRAINNSEARWPETLTGRPRQAYELWRDKLKPAGYRLRAMIVEWPGGMPGDVGFYLEWGQKQA
jgi:hypothetical protein